MHCPSLALSVRDKAAAVYSMPTSPEEARIIGHSFGDWLKAEALPVRFSWYDALLLPSCIAFMLRSSLPHLRSFTSFQMCRIPEIDFGRFLQGSSQERQQTAAEVDHAMSTVGSLILRRHGLDQNLTDGVFNWVSSHCATIY